MGNTKVFLKKKKKKKSVWSWTIQKFTRRWKTKACRVQKKTKKTIKSKKNPCFSYKKS